MIRDLKKEFPECGDFPEGSRLKTVLDEVYGQTGQGFVFIIDEWDCVFRLAKERKEVQREYLDFLRGLFKGAEYVDLAYMTGILPIKKYGEHSALNIFEEYSMLDSAELAMFFGFTEEEVHGLWYGFPGRGEMVRRLSDERHPYLQPKVCGGRGAAGEVQELLDRHRDL